MNNMLAFNQDGYLIAGIHSIPWDDFMQRYSFSSRRKNLFTGMRLALLNFRDAGCKHVYIDGSFVTTKFEPNDYDACWEVGQHIKWNLLDPVFVNVPRHGTDPQIIKYGGEFYPDKIIEGRSGLTFLDFFQQDRDGNRKGIVRIDLRSVA